MSGYKKVVTCRIKPPEKLGKATYHTEVLPQSSRYNQNIRVIHILILLHRYRTVVGTDSVEVLAKRLNKLRNHLMRLRLRISPFPRELTEIRPVPKSLPFIGFFSKACRMPESSPNIGLSRRACRIPGRTPISCRISTISNL
jgi:hypothetical protein